MSDKEDRDVASRRNFLKLAGASAPAAVIAATTGTPAAADTEVLEGNGLRSTLHTEAYWESVRF